MAHMSILLVQKSNAAGMKKGCLDPIPPDELREFTREISEPDI